MTYIPKLNPEAKYQYPCHFQSYIPKYDPEAKLQVEYTRDLPPEVELCLDWEKGTCDNITISVDMPGCDFCFNLTRENVADLAKQCAEFLENKPDPQIITGKNGIEMAMIMDEAVGVDVKFRDGVKMSFPVISGNVTLTNGRNALVIESTPTMAIAIMPGALGLVHLDYKKNGWEIDQQKTIEDSSNLDLAYERYKPAMNPVENARPDPRIIP